MISVSEIYFKIFSKKGLFVTIFNKYFYITDKDYRFSIN